MTAASCAGEHVTQCEPSCRCHGLARNICWWRRHGCWQASSCRERRHHHGGVASAGRPSHSVRGIERHRPCARISSSQWHGGYGGIGHGMLCSSARNAWRRHICWARKSLFLHLLPARIARGKSGIVEKSPPPIEKKRYKSGFQPPRAASKG